MKVIAYFDGCYINNSESYIGNLLIYPDGSKEELFNAVSYDVKNASEVEVLSLYNLTLELVERKIENVEIIGDLEQLINRINKIKSRLLDKSYTLTKGFDKSLQYAVIEKLILNQGWNLKRVKSKDNLAHNVSRRLLNK